MTGEEDVIEREIFVAAAPDIVFGFLVDPTLMAKWIGLLQKLDPRPGGIFQVEVSRGNVARGVYTEVRPFRRVAFTWGWETQDRSLSLLPPGASLVEFDLEPKHAGTLVRLRHSRLPTASSAIHGERWSLYLGQLEAAVRSHSRDEAAN